jgi:hypothetical protein
MERHVAHDPSDVEVLALVVEWIYLLHSSGAVAHTRAEDLTIARTYAEAYEKTNGPALPLVKEWMTALEAGRR